MPRVNKQFRTVPSSRFSLTARCVKAPESISYDWLRRLWIAGHLEVARSNVRVLSSVRTRSAEPLLETHPNLYCGALHPSTRGQSPVLHRSQCHQTRTWAEHNQYNWSNQQPDQQHQAKPKPYTSSTRMAAVPSPRVALMISSHQFPARRGRLLLS